MSSHPYTRIFFDLDGTLSDPSEGIINGFRYTFQQMNRTVADDFDFAPCIGPPLAEIFRSTFSYNEPDVELAVNFYRDYYAQHGWQQNTMFKGIDTLFSDLRSAGKKLYVVTNKPTHYAEKILHHFGLHEQLSAVAGQPLDMSALKKSDLAHGILHTFSPEERAATVLIGDTIWDIEAARTCGISAIAVTYGFGKREELHAQTPEHLVENVMQLREILLH